MRGGEGLNRGFEEETCLWVVQEDAKSEYLEASRISGLVQNYSQFISFPIYTWQELSRSKTVQMLWHRGGGWGVGGGGFGGVDSRREMYQGVMMIMMMMMMMMISNHQN